MLCGGVSCDVIVKGTRGGCGVRLFKENAVNKVDSKRDRYGSMRYSPYPSVMLLYVVHR